MGKQFPWPWFVVLILLLVLFAGPHTVMGQTAAAGAGIHPQPLVVNFEKNSSDPSARSKNKIQEFLGRYDIGADSRIFVIGYTDKSGKKKYNQALSRRRALTVQRIVEKSLRLNPDQIIAIGKGPEFPTAAKTGKNGFNENRRVEIYLFNVAEKSLSQNKPNSKNPEQQKQDCAAVESLVREAGQLLRRQQLDEALRKLQQGRALGGDQSADWHAAYGIAGFYAGVDPHAVQAHLNMALRLDPFHYEARDFSGRLDARLKLADGRIDATMGQSPDAPITVNSKAQEYEYLSLFQVQPLSHDDLHGRPVHVWQCRDRQNQPVVYYFEYGAIHAKIFEPITSSATRSSQAREASSSKNTTGLPPVDSHNVWESKLFR